MCSSSCLRGGMQSFYVAGSTAKASGPPPPASRRNPGTHGWLLRQAERMEVARAAGLQRAAAHAAAQPKAGPPEPPPQEDFRTVLGLRSAGFLPGRRVWYIMGRPVCVRGWQQRVGNTLQHMGTVVSLPPDTCALYALAL